MTTPNCLTIDDLTFEVRWSTRRSTVGVTVDRDSKLIVHAPCGLRIGDIEAVVRTKQMWIYSTLARKASLQHPRATREYISGEGFFYLGRSYRLRIVSDTTQPLRLYRGWFELQDTLQSEGQKTFTNWYQRHGRQYLTQRVADFADRVGSQPTAITVTSLGNRWGSCSKSGRISFHWRTILLPRRIVEYIVVHELAHLDEHRHNAVFWDRVERVLPDWQHRANWLTLNGAEYDL